MSRVSALAAALGAIAERTQKAADNHKGALGVHAEVNRIRKAAAALADAHASRSPLVTPAAHTKALADMARRFDKEALAGFNRATEAMRSGRDDVQRRIADKVNFKEDTYGRETREYFRTLSIPDKMSLISELIGENRGPELAALLKAPRSATGLSAEQIERFEQLLYSTHAKDELAELELIDAVHDGALAAYDVATDLARSMTDPGELARIEREASEANAASDAFNQAMQSAA